MCILKSFITAVLYIASTGIYVICDCVWKIRCCRNWCCPVFQYFKNESTLISRTIRIFVVCKSLSSECVNPSSDVRTQCFFPLYSTHPSIIPFILFICYRLYIYIYILSSTIDYHFVRCNSIFSQYSYISSRIYTRCLYAYMNIYIYMSVFVFILPLCWNRDM